MKWILLGMFVCIILIVVVFIVYKTMKPLNLPTMHNFAISKKTEISKAISPPPHPTESCKEFPLAIGCGVVGKTINICTQQYPNYPPLSDILTTKDNPNVGVYEGTINNLDASLHTITVIPKSQKPFTFLGGSVNGALYDIHQDPIDDFHTLQTGVKAVISFPCTQKTGIFKLNRFQLVQ